jgi:hypothetical protein
MNGPFTLPDEKENPAADEIFAGGSARHEPKQPVTVPSFTGVSDRINSAAAEASTLGRFPTIRYKGEDLAADAIFEGRTRP